MCRRGDEFDAYVLSESSLFVYDTLVVAKTCGTTCLLNACSGLVSIAEQLGLQPVRCKYSRPSFQFPQNQRSPHRSFDEEVALLQRSFSHLRGGTCAHTLGSSISAGLQWFVYAADDRPPPPKDCDEVSNIVSTGKLFAGSVQTPQIDSGCQRQPDAPDVAAPADVALPLEQQRDTKQAAANDSANNNMHLSGCLHHESDRDVASLTIEVSMTGLARSAAAHFYNEENNASVEEVARNSGIVDLFPDATLDGIVFCPCGYSLNAMRGRRFLTVHVTPEEHCSYASVELGGVGREYDESGKLIELVLNIFKPQTASILLSGESSSALSDCVEARSVPGIEGYTRVQLSKQALQCGGFVHFATLEAQWPERESVNARANASAEVCDCPSVSEGLQEPRSGNDTINTGGVASSDEETESANDLFDGMCMKAAMPKVMRRDDEETALNAVASQYGALASTNPITSAAALRGLVQPYEELVHIVDLRSVLQRWHEWHTHMPRAGVCYAVKSNADPAILQLLVSIGSGFDCAAPAEIEQVLSLGAEPSSIVYANPCKPPSHAKRAEALGVNLTVVDSTSEVRKIAHCMPSASVLLRIAAADESARCPMDHKYGASDCHWQDIINACVEYGVLLSGVAFHIGSGASEPGAFAAAVKSARRAIDCLKASNATPRNGQPLWVDIGGGMSSVGASVHGAAGKELARALDEHFQDKDEVAIIAEPGRFITECAVTVAAEVIGVRKSKPPSYWVKDGVYGSFNCMLFDHAECPKPLPFATDAKRQQELECQLQTVPSLSPSYVFGPTCDGLDTLLTNEPLPDLMPGDWLAFPAMGAYTISAASSFNGFHPGRDALTRYVVH